MFNLNLNNMPGRNLWSTTSATALRDRRVVDRAGIDPDLKPMSQDQTNVGIEYQLSGSTMVGAHYVHNSLQNTIEDIGTLVDGNETYIIGNPGRGLATVTPTQGSPRHSPRRKPCAPTMRWS